MCSSGLKRVSLETVDWNRHAGFGRFLCRCVWLAASVKCLRSYRCAFRGYVYTIMIVLKQKGLSFAFLKSFAYNVVKTSPVHMKWKWSDVTYGQVWWPILGICALHLSHPKCTHSSEHTHTVNTHPEQWAAIYAAAPGEQLGVRCLAQGHLSRGIEGGESAVHSLPPPTIPSCRDSNPQPSNH